MSTEPRIEQLPSKKIIGIYFRTTLAENRTTDLWRTFMPRRHEIPSTVGTDLYSIQVYDHGWSPQAFTPHITFNRWAAVEVSDITTIPAGMEPLNLEGSYAVFIHHGPPSAFIPTFQRIFQEWLPASDYVLDDRPHFEILGAKYKNEHPDSEEEIWIPVRPR
ncbi:GyrI-like domain-containing protein [Parachryseolinea silvisoli]|jgi:AraC family transcriptional regulator|uniref:GyrI-like domain-containing protein n=1 Tax=Parachryseolinea silvisoli TaxID=2873601 RepID=UPI002265DFC7|nr:GyrI-like domain-containing protein [Parachryseolinea silvisoli]MCD9014721.1 GyrI-like domain-containing protein [Parachryseolinea silvisoli]